RSGPRCLAWEESTKETGTTCVTLSTWSASTKNSVASWKRKRWPCPDFEADALTPERSLENYHPFCGPALDSRPVPARFPYFSDVPEIASAKQATVPDVL